MKHIDEIKLWDLAENFPLSNKKELSKKDQKHLKECAFCKETLFQIKRSLKSAPKATKEELDHFILKT